MPQSAEYTTGAVLHELKDWTEAGTNTQHKTAKWSKVGVRHFRMSNGNKTNRMIKQLV